MNANYVYDPFGNRTRKEDYSGQTSLQTTYRYNANNQLTSRTDEEGEQTYTYDHRGNLTAVSRGEQQIKAFTFDAANRMDSAYEIKDGIGTRAEYTYNAFGNRTGQDIYSMEPDNAIPETAPGSPRDPERRITYTLDLTRQYHNLLTYEDKEGQKKQTFYWDGNVAVMEEDGTDSYYLQDDLGSPMQLMDEKGKVRETYGFDEFGRNLAHSPEKQLQPFGYTGYQTEETGGLYFAQARRYDADNGRFISEDKIAGFTSAPYTLNRYNYCWNQPLEHVDLNGRFPWLIVAAVVLVATAVAVDTAAIHSIDMMDEHYGRNQNQEEYFAQYTDDEIIEMVELGRDGWVPAPASQNAYHRFTNGTQGMDAIYNVKYLKEFPDGTSYEIVICQGMGLDDDYIVRDPKNMGTYNYHNPNGLGGSMGHFWDDMVPYWYFSNTLGDALTIVDRLFGNSNAKKGTADYKDKECIE